MSKEIFWRFIGDATYILPVPGGTLFRYNGREGVAMTFVPTVPKTKSIEVDEEETEEQ